MRVELPSPIIIHDTNFRSSKKQILRSLSSKRYIYFTLRPDMTLPLLNVTDSLNKIRETLGNNNSSLIAVNILQRKTCMFLLVAFVLKLLLQQQQ